MGKTKQEKAREAAREAARETEGGAKQAEHTASLPCYLTSTSLPQRFLTRLFSPTHANCFLRSPRSVLGTSVLPLPPSYIPQSRFHPTPAQLAQKKSSHSPPVPTRSIKASAPPSPPQAKARLRYSSSPSKSQFHLRLPLLGPRNHALLAFLLYLAHLSQPSPSGQRRRIVVQRQPSLSAQILGENT
jgi:hypothetical protein